MRRVLVVSLAMVSACAIRQSSGDQSLAFTVPNPADTLLARARTELAQMGYEINPTEERMVLTTPRPIPDSLTAASAGETDPSGHLWVLRVTAADQVFSAGSRGTVTAFIFRADAGDVTPGNVVLQTATPVTATSTPGLFSEVQRVADRIREAASRRTSP